MYTVKNRTDMRGKKLLPDSIYFRGFKPAVIDIETTGLSPARDFIYLIGVLTEEDGEGCVTQFLAKDRNDEKALLLAFGAFIADYDLLLNYNGQSFDIPFINKRAEKHGLSLSLDCRMSLDYLRLFRESYLKEMLPDLKLKTVEKVAGVFREDRFSGKDCIELYKQFSTKDDREAGRKVLLHNFEDISCFPNLNSLSERIDLHRSLTGIGFPVKSGEAVFYINGIKCKNGAISATGTVSGLSAAAEIYESDYTLIAEGPVGKFSLTIEVDTDKINTTGLINEVIVDTLQNKVLL